MATAPRALEPERNIMPLRVLSLVLHSFETDSRVLRACNSLISAGYAVTVGALHEGSLPERQKMGDIDVERVRLRTRGWSKWRPIQLIKYFEWVIRVAWRFRDNDIIHCNDINTLPAGTLLKALTGGRARVVYDAHEFESNHKAGQSALSIRLMQLLEGFFIRFADRVVTVSDSIADEYARIYKIARPDVVLNVPWLQTVSSDDRFRRRFGIRPDQTIFLTQGWLRPNRGIETMLEAFAAMPDDSRVLVVMGRGVLEETVNAYAARSPNIFHQPVVPPDQVIAHTVAADYGIALIHGTSFSYEHCLPNKLFEYVMGGLPVIVSDLPEMRAVVNRLGLGVVCEEISATALTAACAEICALDQAELTKNVAAAGATFNWDVQQKVWLNVVKEVSR
jgi:glycosyltransferase involved in cell wall biosynthesis